jgi:Bacteriophage HK97-gp10, putative tail-component
MPVTFKFDDPNAVYLAVERMLRGEQIRLQAIPDRAVRRGTFELLRLVQSRVVKGATSTLVRSITAVVRRISDDLIEGTVGTYVEYAKYLEFGTGIYGPKKQLIVIRPKVAGGLNWGAFRENGKELTVKKVVQKGIRPRLYFATALQDFIPRYLEIIQEELAKAA